MKRWLLNIKNDYEKMKKHKLLQQILRFGIVGGIAFIIDYVILIICRELLGLPVLLAAAIAFSLSVIVNYLLSVKWVFTVNNKNKTKNFILFLVLSIIGLLLTELIMWFGTDKLQISYLIVKIFATIIVMVFNFITRKLILEKK